MSTNHPKNDSTQYPSLDQINQQMNQLEDNAIKSAMQLGTQVPPLNTKETNNEYEVDMAAPGLDKSNFKVQVNNGVLSVNCETSNQTSSNDKGFQRQEYSYSQFQRNVAIPANCDVNKTQASYRNGVLKITAPKSNESQNNNVNKDIQVN